MKRNVKRLNTEWLAKVTLAVALVVGGSNMAVADEVTLNENATGQSYGIPFNAKKIGNDGHYGEFILTAEQLGIANKNITALKFYPKADAELDATFDVCLKEVEETAYPATGAKALGSEGTTTVYSGSVTVSSTDGMTIVFSTPFTYSGDNSLLIRFNRTSGTSITKDLYFTGLSGYSATNYMSWGATYNDTPSRQGFQPKVTITYENAAAVTLPKLSVSTTSIAFGSLRANDTQTVTVTNNGAGSMDVTIASDNTTDFTLSATSLTDIGEGESKTFDVTFNYNAENLGEKTANITVTPSYDAEDAKAITVTATAADINVWEDFDDGIPSTWYNQNSSWLNYVLGLSGYASPNYQSNDVLRTPRLYAEEGEALGFDVKIVGKYSSNIVTSRYSTDRVNWSDKVNYSADGTYSIVAPATGYYWVEFTASQAGIDNMTGWTIADAIHDTRLGAVTIPAKGTAHGTYTATVVVKELGGSAETVSAALYFGDEKVAEEENIAIGGNRDVTVTLSYTPTEEFSGNVYIKVTGENIGTLETDPVAVEVTETPYVFDEDGDENPVISTSSVVKVKYTAQKGWNTIVMPFSLSGSSAYMNTIFGEDWTAYALSSYDNGIVKFESTTYMATTTPFLVYAPNAESHPDGVYLQNVSAGSYNWGHSNINKTADDVTFKGTFQPIAAPGMEGKYGVTSTGSVAKGGSGASIKAYRAYLEVADDADARLTIVIDDDGQTTAIGGLMNQLTGRSEQVYNLNGQRVEKATKGLYIIGGRKVIVK
ncbi:MAG: hypothetical protein IJV34_08465 [Prevotella sp.]|nr:hypothetical protein [Prevotella sp.]